MAKKDEIIVLIGTMDTKGPEFSFIKKEIESKGYKTLVVDTGILGKPKIKVDIPKEEVAKKGGYSLEELVAAAKKGADRSAGTSAMTEGAIKMVNILLSDGKLDGILSLGGSQGTAMGMEIMKVLPLGLPKIMVTTDLDLQDFDDRDIMMIQAPADIFGLNTIIKKMLLQAVGAMDGMLESKKLQDR
ncbi:MAG: Tm-1-like ATP-binding domain-containing protein [Candidatus Helarchaeota archaeon]|nr:Tm-1-like ATP-binding domain-containing protein [Candidatus Helarchaeota archaeon]